MTGNIIKNGIFACKTQEQVFMELEVYPSTYIVGTVYMWGEVVEHERGYRAEYASIKSLDLMRPETGRRGAYGIIWQSYTPMKLWSDMEIEIGRAHV